MAERVPDFDALDRVLRDSAADARLDNDERLQLRNIGAQATSDEIRFVRNRAFAIARESISNDAESATELLRWLEQVVKTLDVSAAVAVAATSAFFSPGDACLRKLRELCGAARATIDVCVFTIADDRLTDELLASHRRGVRVRVISDNDKQFDGGSDIGQLIEAGVPVLMDGSPFHMHHKFALFDGSQLANGSFNWTRTASTSNFENLVVSADPYLVRVFGAQFESLWSRFSPHGRMG